VPVQPERLGALAPQHGGGFAEGVEGHGERGCKMGIEERTWAGGSVAKRSKSKWRRNMCPKPRAVTI
jgi:hypothetical protein